jgi:cytidylate kinase
MAAGDLHAETDAWSRARSTRTTHVGHLSRKEAAMPGQFERLSGVGFHFPHAAVTAGQYSMAHEGEHKPAAKSEPPPPPVFVTVSREPGAGAITFSHRLAERLNALMPARDVEPGGGPPAWSAWDRELVEKVAQETGITRSVIEKIEERPHSWLDDFFQGFSQSGESLPAAEVQAFKRIALAVRALATAGHAIIVGQGGAFVTRGMAGGVHVRLVATLEQRIKLASSTYNLSPNKAAARIREIEHNRTAFFHRFWPGKVLTPEMFTMTLNAGEMSLDELVECVLPIIRSRDASLMRATPSMSVLDVVGALSL